MSDLECPYCGHEQQACYDDIVPGDYETECDKCGMEYRYLLEYEPVYYVYGPDETDDLIDDGEPDGQS
jgi:transcription elongation factor Elf1